MASQVVRATDIGKERFEGICAPRRAKTLELTSQMRCRGGNGYLDYVHEVLRGQHLDIEYSRHIKNYEVETMDSVSDLFDVICEREADEGLSRVAAGPGWSMNDDITIEGNIYHWATGDAAPKRGEQGGSSIYSVHKVQGFDLNYAGVIFGREVYYDEEKGRIAVNKSLLKDGHMKSAGDESMLDFVLNVYEVLMTRAIKGTYVYAVDKRLREYLQTFFC